MTQVDYDHMSLDEAITQSQQGNQIALEILSKMALGESPKGKATAAIHEIESKSKPDLQSH